MTLDADLAALPAAYAMLGLYRLPGSQPTDIGSNQHNGVLTYAVLNFTVLDLTDERDKPDADAWRTPAELERDKALGRRQGILPTLGQWVRLVEAERLDNGIPTTPPTERPTVQTECDWLIAVLDWIQDQPWADEITADIGQMLHDCRIVAGEVDVKEALYCLNPQCGWKVTEVDGAYYRCTGCGRSWGRLELHRMAERKRPKPLPECARLAGVAERTLRRYATDGRIPVAARTGTTNLYDIDQVMQATMDLRYRDAVKTG